MDHSFNPDWLETFDSRAKRGEATDNKGARRNPGIAAMKMAQQNGQHKRKAKKTIMLRKPKPLRGSRLNRYLRSYRSLPPPLYAKQPEPHSSALRLPTTSTNCPKVVRVSSLPSASTEPSVPRKQPQAGVELSLVCQLKNLEPAQRPLTLRRVLNSLLQPDEEFESAWRSRVLLPPEVHLHTPADDADSTPVLDPALKEALHALDRDWKDRGLAITDGVYRLALCPAFPSQVYTPRRDYADADHFYFEVHREKEAAQMAYVVQTTRDHDGSDTTEPSDPASPTSPADSTESTEASMLRTLEHYFAKGFVDAAKKRAEEHHATLTSRGCGRGGGHDGSEEDADPAEHTQLPEGHTYDDFVREFMLSYNTPPDPASTASTDIPLAQLTPEDLSPPKVERRQRSRSPHNSASAPLLPPTPPKFSPYRPRCLDSCCDEEQRSPARTVADPPMVPEPGSSLSPTQPWPNPTERDGPVFGPRPESAITASKRPSHDSCSLSNAQPYNKKGDGPGRGTALPSVLSSLSIVDEVASCLRLPSCAHLAMVHRDLRAALKPQLQFVQAAYGASTYMDECEYCSRRADFDSYFCPTTSCESLWPFRGAETPDFSLCARCVCRERETACSLERTRSLQYMAPGQRWVPPVPRPYTFIDTSHLREPESFLRTRNKCVPNAICTAFKLRYGETGALTTLVARLRSVLTNPYKTRIAGVGHTRRGRAYSPGSGILAFDSHTGTT